MVADTADKIRLTIKLLESVRGLNAENFQRRMGTESFDLIINRAIEELVEALNNERTVEEPGGR